MLSHKIQNKVKKYIGKLKRSAYIAITFAFIYLATEEDSVDGQRMETKPVSHATIKSQPII